MADGNERRRIEEILFGRGSARRFTQDSPVLPDVWYAYGEPDGEKKLDLLLVPHYRCTPGNLYRLLRERLAGEREADRDERRAAQDARLAYNHSTVVARLSFDEMIRVALPLTAWWRQHVKPYRDMFRPWDREGGLSEVAKRLEKTEFADRLTELEARLTEQQDTAEAPTSEAGFRFSPDFIWLVRLIAAVKGIEPPKRKKRQGNLAAFLDAACSGSEFALSPEEWRAFESASGWDRETPDDRAGADDGLPPLWTINVNRPAEPAIRRSVLCVKADAALSLFNISCSDLAWAVVDTGIDLQHPAFEYHGPEVSDDPPYREWTEKGQLRRTRILASCDFTRLRRLLDVHALSGGSLDFAEILGRDLQDDEADTLQKALDQVVLDLETGHMLNWDALLPFLRIDPALPGYPPDDHGTHVAAILASRWVGADGQKIEAQGLCPDIRLYDLRVFCREGDVLVGDEFTVMAALQFVQHLNSHKNIMRVHGVNLSLSIRHDVGNYACGRTPVCEEANRLAASGVVVVAAAGNQGYDGLRPGVRTEGYRSISITDPGNADGVITVGATHREFPHTYGVSYFSSRGPTGDGRLKPDLVAPGEKIVAPVFRDKGLSRKDGTSMAAPHVSGAAALLMARHRELVGQPARVKEILCRTATDLGRERYFQGHGLVDVLRALQSV